MESTYESPPDYFILKWIALAINIAVKINIINMLDIDTVIK